MSLITKIVLLTSFLNISAHAACFVAASITCGHPQSPYKTGFYLTAEFETQAQSHHCNEWSHVAIQRAIADHVNEAEPFAVGDLCRHGMISAHEVSPITSRSRSDAVSRTSSMRATCNQSARQGGAFVACLHVPSTFIYK